MANIDNSKSTSKWRATTTLNHTFTLESTKEEKAGEKGENKYLTIILVKGHRIVYTSYLYRMSSVKIIKHISDT